MIVIHWSVPGCKLLLRKFKSVIETKCVEFLLCSLTGNDVPTKRAQDIKFNKKQLRLCSLRPVTSERDIRIFLHKLGLPAPNTIKFSHDNTAAMVGFQSNIGISYKIVVPCMHIQVQQI